MHRQLNRFNFSIKLNWLTWLNKQISKNGDLHNSYRMVKVVTMVKLVEIFTGQKL